jgi:hypothetical protein
MDRSWSVSPLRVSSQVELALRWKDRGAGLAGLPAEAGRGEGVRTELVERVRREIAAGTYDTPERWEAALDRLAERLLPS